MACSAYPPLPSGATCQACLPGKMVTASRSFSGVQQSDAIFGCVSGGQRRSRQFPERGPAGLVVEVVWTPLL